MNLGKQSAIIFVNNNKIKRKKIREKEIREWRAYSDANYE